MKPITLYLTTLTDQQLKKDKLGFGVGLRAKKIFPKECSVSYKTFTPNRHIKQTSLMDLN
jgi:hypothetical protein